MAKLNFIVPNPDGSGRYCVFDPVAGRYVRGGINVSRVQAERLMRESRPADWQTLAKAAGWMSPEEVEAKVEAAIDLTKEASKEELESLGQDREFSEPTGEDL